MNHIYRIVWNTARGAWVAVAEFARSHTGSSGRSAARLSAPVFVGLTCAWSIHVLADGSVVTANVATGSYVAPNGVTVVDIARANGAGLSHNQFLQYNVDSKGLVLNNGNADQVARLSQLAGLVSANANLDRQASVILNEVVSNNRSILAGFTEVLGGKADVVIANPYGITCSGCGFINTDRVTLSTGRPEIGPSGELSSLSVSGGDILVNGSGLNANAQLLDLVTRRVRLAAPVNAADLGLIAGTNRWDYPSRTVTGAVAAEGDAPTRAIDTAALGGMYADRIRLIATEAGVGVRMLGDAAASASDFTLTAAGAVELRGQVAAQRDIAVASSNTGAAALGVHDAVLSAGRDIALNSAGGAVLEGSALFATRDLDVTATTLTDNASNAAITDNNLRYAGRALQLNISGTASVDATTWQTAGTWQGNVGSLTVGAGGAGFFAGQTLTLTASSGDLDLATATVLAQDDVDLSTTGAIRTAAAAAQGVSSIAGDIDLRADDGIVNAGKISADAGALRVRANGLDNSGAVYAADGIDIADRNGGTGGDLDNSGTLYTDGNLSLLAANVTNTASGLIQANGGSLVQANDLTNAGDWLLSNSAGTADNLTLSGTLTNDGQMQSQRALDIDANRIENNGSLIALDELNIDATTGYANGAGAVLKSFAGLSLDAGSGALDNAANALILATDIELTASGGIDNAGHILADGGLTLRATGLDNSGEMYGADSLDIADRNGNGSGSFDNSGTLYTDGALILKAAASTNAATGLIQARSGSQIDLASLTNDGVWLLSTTAGAADRLDVTGILANNGLLQSESALAITADSVDNDGELLALGNLDVTATTALTNQTDAIIQSDARLRLNSGSGELANKADGLIAAAAVELTATGGVDNAGQIHALSGGLKLRATGLINSGEMYGASSLDIADINGAASGDLDNSGNLYTDGALVLLAADATNTASGWIQAANGSQITLASLDNAGGWLLSTTAGALDSLILSGQLDNTGLIKSARALDVQANRIDNSANLIALGNLDLDAATGIGNDAGATLQSGATLTLDSGSGALDNAAGAVILADEMTLTASGGIDNAGEISARVGSLTLRANGLDNSGKLYGASSLDIADRNDGASGDLDNSGEIYTDGALELKAAAATNQAGALIQAGTGSQVQLASLDNTGDWLFAITAGATTDTLTVSGDVFNSGNLQSAQKLTIAANSITNLVSVGLDAVGDPVNHIGAIYAGDDLTLTISGGNASGEGVVNNNGTSIGSDGTLSIDAGGHGLRNYGSGMIVANKLDLHNIDTLTNSGTLQGGTAADSLISASGLIENSGTITLATDAAGGGTLSAGSLTNDGTVQSLGTLDILVDTRLDNNGTIVAEGDTTLRGRLNASYTFDNFGLLQSGGALDIAGYQGDAQLNLGLKATGEIIGQTVNIHSTGFGIEDGGKLASIGNMTVRSDSLLSKGSTARILAVTGGSGTADIAVTNSFINKGLVYSGDALLFSANSITNNDTAAFVAQGDATLVSQFNFMNSGAIWSGGILTARVAGMLKNYGTLSAPTGTIDAEQGIVIEAQTLINNGTINSRGDLAIKADTIRNETSNLAVGGSGWNWVYEPQVTFPSDTTARWSRSMSYNDGEPFKPQIIGAGTVKLYDFEYATNLRAVISGDTVILTGKAGATPTFNNDELALDKEIYTDDLDDWYHWASAIEPTWGGIYGEWSITNLAGFHQAQSTEKVASSGVGIYARVLDASGFALTNKGTPQSVNTTPHGEETVQGEDPQNPVNAPAPIEELSLHAATPLNIGGPISHTAPPPTDPSDPIDYQSPNAPPELDGINFGGIHFTPPSNPNGYFIGSPDPDADYLIETNPLFLSVPGGSNGLDSDYLAKELGYDPDSLVKRLGDGGYEAYLVQQELVAQTGRNLLQGYESSEVQLKQFMDNAVAESATLGLVFGAAPSEAQLAALQNDMVWMVESMVSGQRVLAPVVYLSAKTRDSILHGSVIQADHIYMDLDKLTNAGGTISGGKTLSVVSTGDIVNLSGTITGGRVALKSTEGSIVNKRLGQTTGKGVDNGNTPAGTISSTENLSLVAGKEIINDRSKIDAGKKLTMIGSGDISNLSGSITGGEIAMKSEKGSIVNKTLSAGNDKNTVIGSTASIASRGDLTMIAGKKIDVVGAQVKAGGDAWLDAAEGIGFDTIEKRASSSSASKSEGFLYSKKTASETTEITQVKSGLEVGGNLVAKSGKDITFAGTDVTVGGSAALKASGDVNVIARADKTVSKTKTEESGLGVGGGLWGDSKTTTDKTSSRNVGSTFKVGGDASIKANGDVTLQGSQMSIGGDADIRAKNINVLDGLDKEETHSKTTTTTILRVTAGTGDSSSEADAKASGVSKQNLIKGAASASANAKAGGKGGLEFLANEDTEVDSTNSKSVASVLKVGGNASLKASKNVTIQGSKVDVGGDVDVEAEKVELLAGRDVSTSKTKTTTVSIGLMGSSSNEAGAGAEASGRGDLVGGAGSGNLNAKVDAGAKSETGLVLFQHEDKTTEESEVKNHAASLSAGGNMSVRAKTLELKGSTLSAEGDVDVKADTIKLTTAEDSKTSKTTSIRTSIGLMAESDNSASAEAGARGGVKNLAPSANVGADAGSNNTLNLLKVEASTDSSLETKNQASAIRAGGNMKLKANQLSVKGSQLEAGGDMDLRAKDMSFEAVEDRNETRSSTSTTTAGLYGEAGTGAHANAQINANADASVEIGMGYQVSNTTKSQVDGSTKAVTSGIKAGGNLHREASGGITDEGTQIEVGGNMSQSAATITSKAAKDTTYASSSSDTHTGKVGMYAGASAEAGVGAGAGYDASVGGRVSYANEQEATTSKSSDAVVSNIKVGGGFSSKSSGKTSLEGTNIETGGDTSLAAGSLEYKAARNTTSETASGTEAGGVLSVNINAESVIGGSASASYANSEETSNSSKAVVGKINSGGKLTIKTTGDAKFEGSELASKGDADIRSGGKVDFAAAKDTESSTGRNIDASFSVGMSTGGSAKKSSGKNETSGMLEVGGGYSQGEASRETGKAAKVNSGGNLSVSSGGDMRLEGTTLAGKGETSVTAGGDLTVEAVRDITKTDGFGVSAKLGGSGGKTSGATTSGSSGVSPGEGTAGLGGSYNSSEDVKSTGASISGGGKVSVSAGKNMSLEGTTLKAGAGEAEVKAGGTVTKTEAKNSSRGVAVGIDVEISVSKKEKTEDKTKNAGTGTGTGTPPPPPPKKGSSSGTGSGTGTPPPLPPKKGSSTGTGSGAGTPPPLPPKKGSSTGTGSGAGTPPPLPPKKGSSTDASSGAGTPPPLPPKKGSSTDASSGAGTPPPLPPKKGSSTDASSGAGTPPPLPPKKGTSTDSGSGAGTPPPLPPKKGSSTDLGSGAGTPPPLPPKKGSNTDSGSGAGAPPPLPAKKGSSTDSGSGAGTPPPLPPKKGSNTDSGSGAGAPPPLPAKKGSNTDSGSVVGAPPAIKPAPSGGKGVGNAAPTGLGGAPSGGGANDPAPQQGGNVVQPGVIKGLIGGQGGGNAAPPGLSGAQAGGGANHPAPQSGSAAPSGSQSDLIKAAGGGQSGGNAAPSVSQSELINAAGGAQRGGNAAPSASQSELINAAGGAQRGGNAAPSVSQSELINAAGGAQRGGNAAPSASQSELINAAGGAQRGGNAAPSVSQPALIKAAGGGQGSGNAAPLASQSGLISAAGGGQSVGIAAP